MAVPSWFDEYTYLQSKLNQLTSAGQTQYSNVTQVKAAIEAAGMSVYQHFEKFSLAERTSPNTYFNTQEYLEAKAAQLNTAQDVTTWTADKVALEFQNAGFTNAYEHFSKYGWAEGVNPSNSFDVSSYLEAKAAATDKAVDEVKAAFEAAGLDPIAHYETYGKSEGITVTEVPAGEQVTPDSSGSTGQTFVLTENTDALTGTAGNDTFTAGLKNIGGTPTATLNALDNINGGAGTDTLIIEGAQALTGTLAVEVVKYVGDISGFSNDGTSNAITVDASKVTGLTHLWFDGVTIGDANDDNSLAVSNLTAGQSIGVKGSLANNGTNGVDIAATYADSVTAATVYADEVYGSDTATTIAATLNGAGLKTITVDGSTKKTDTITGSITLDDQANNVTTLNLVVGTGKVLNVNADALTGLTTVDASTSAGGVTVDVSAVNTAMTVKGGSGDDKFDLGANLTADDTVTGGAGTDTLTVDYANGSIFGTDKLTKVTGIEKGELAGAAMTASDAVTFDVSKIGATTAKIGALTLTNAANGTAESASLAIQGIANNGTVELAGDLVATLATEDTITTTIAVDGAQTRTDDVLNLKVGAAAAGVTIQSLSIDQVETVNIESVGGANTISDLILGDDTTTIKLSGSKAVTITAFANTGDDKVATIDASAMTADVTLSDALTPGTSVTSVTFIGGSKIDTYTASGKADKITGNGGADVITLGAGADTVIYKATTDSTSTEKDTINGFTTGQDVLKFEGLLKGTFSYLGTTAFTNTGNSEARFANGTSNDLLVDVDGNGSTDMVITLTGVTTTGVAQGDFVWTA